MPRSLSPIAACLLALVFCSPGRGQDSRSAGETARQSQKDKDSKPPVKVITNEDMKPVSAGISSALGAGVKHDEDRGANERLEYLQAMLDQLASMDRATLVKNVLGGNPSNSPGLAKWENELFAAKQTFVSQSRDALRKEKQLQESVEDMKAGLDPNDPRLKTIVEKLQDISQETQEANAAFQAVITEGKGFAGPNAKH
jgi:TATA-binding protein-associated factor Taf7